LSRGSDSRRAKSAARDAVYTSRRAIGRASLDWPAAVIVGLCSLVNMLHVMDVLILSYIAPALQKEWAIGAQRIGAVFSAGIVGMAIGALAIAPLADVFGRRRVTGTPYSTLAWLRTPPRAPSTRGILVRHPVLPVPAASSPTLSGSWRSVRWACRPTSYDRRSRRTN
jgi:MFS family permease